MQGRRDLAQRIADFVRELALLAVFFLRCVEVAAEFGGAGGEAAGVGEPVRVAQELREDLEAGIAVVGARANAAARERSRLARARASGSGVWPV